MNLDFNPAKVGPFDGCTHWEMVHGPDRCVAFQLLHCLLSPARCADPSYGLGCSLEVSFQSKKEGSDIVQRSFARIRRKVR